MNFQLSDFDYHLPFELIAAFPPEDRTSARLLHVDRQSGAFSHHRFSDLGSFLKSGDVLVLNNTKVLPARLFGVRRTGGKVEALLLKRVSNNQWEALLKPGGRIKKGAMISFGTDGVYMDAEVISDAIPDSGQRVIEFRGEHIDQTLHKIGHIPLPPYIDRPDAEIDRKLYQTVYAEKEGAVAAPTAGLHFDKNLLAKLEEKGVEIIYVTLHTGYGTFQPIVEEDLAKQELFAEEFEVSEQAAAKLNQAKMEGRRVIACGTTSVRTLESACGENGIVKAQRSETRIFIYPPYRFKIISGLITNFHLPKSSLMLLVAAFLHTPNLDGRDKLCRSYQEAISNQYKFYSYGDAMVIL